MRKIIYITFITFLLSLSIKGAVITRDDVISTASQYTPIVNWTPVVDSTAELRPTWHSWYKTSKNGGTPPYNKLAYCWSGFDTPSAFKSRVENNSSPVPAGGYNTSQYTYPRPYIAGIDCSGFVLRCWGISTYATYQQLIDYSLQIDKAALKKGDLLKKSGHSVLYVSGTFPGKCNIYESQAQEGYPPYYPGVVYHTRNVSGQYYTPYSPFPQFNNESPANGAVIDSSKKLDSISVRIYGKGEFTTDNVSMKINDQIANDTVVIINDTSVLLVSYDSTFFDSLSGEVNVEVTARNDVAGNGYVDEYNWKFTINKDSTPPKVISTSPQDGAEDVPIDTTPITIEFSKPMDTTATENALTIDPPVNCSTYWEDSKKLYLTLDHDTLDYCQEYTVTISDAAKDTFGIKLDGDGDGKAGGDYKFSFSTEKPSIVVEAYPKSVDHIEEGQSVSHHIVSKGDSLKDTVNCKIEFQINNPGGWSVSGAEDENFPLSPGGTHTNTYTPINTGATSALDVFYQVGAECSTSPGEGYFWSAQGHMYDHPDENQSPGEMHYPTEWIVRTEGDSTDPGLPDIGIMLSGWADGYGHILGRYFIPTLPVKPDLKIINHPYADISDSVKLLVIGSAGLKGFGSQLMRQKLTDFVAGGGNILVLTQKFGSDLTALPGNINGYGWSEDQSCFHNAVYLSEWHPIFSGQESQLMSCNVDGYITQYPDNAEVLLRRTANGMPALLTYSYGAGRVIVSSLYPDWGYGHNQTSPEELRLFRDLTTYAMNPDMPIPEFYPDSNVSVPVKIYYSDYDTILVKKSIIKIYTPDRELYDSLDMAIDLHYGEDTEFVWNHSSIPDSLGLWVINYALLDSNDQYIQKYKRGAIFAERVDIPTGNYNLGNYQIWANSDKEKVLKGDTINFHVYLKNNTASLFQGKVIIGTHNNPYYWSVINSITGISIPPDSVFEFDSISVAIYNTSKVYFGLYNNNATSYDEFFYNAIAAYYKGVGIVLNPFPLAIKTDSNSYQIGDTVYYSAIISNKLSYTCSLDYKIYTIMDSAKYYIDSGNVILSGNGDTTINGSLFPFDYDSVALGDCEIGCELYHQDTLIYRKNNFFNLLYHDVSISVTLPDSFDYNGLNPYTVKLSSEDSIPHGKLIISGKDYYDSLMIDCPQTSETTLTFNYQPTQWHINDYINVKYKYGNQESNIKKELQFLPPAHSPVAIRAVPANNTFYPGDTAKFSGIFKGRGKLYGAPIKGWVLNCPPGSADSLFDSTIINPGEMTTLNMQTYLGTTLDTTQDGGSFHYEYGIKYLNYAYGNVISHGYNIQPPVVWLEWLFNDTFRIDEQIPVTFTNPIKIASNVKLNYIQLFGNRAYNQETGPGEVEVPPESSYTYLSNIPRWTTGKYNLKINSEIVIGEGHNLDLYKDYGCPIFLKGIESGISVNTDKEWYLHNENIPIESHVNNGDYAFTGVESLFVYPFEETTNVYSSILNNCSFYGVHTENDSLGNPISASIDSFYSLHIVNSYHLNNYAPFILSDGTENIWLIDNSSATLYTPDFRNPLRNFALDSIGQISDCVIKNGWLYIADMNKRKISKINTASGNMAKSWSVPDTIPNYRLGVTCDDNNNVIVVDNLTKKLYKFDNNGNLLDSLNLPTDLNYGDMDFAFGKTYVSSGNKVLTISNTTIDTFCESGGLNYDAISVGKNGELAALNRNNWRTMLYSSDGKMKASSELRGDSKSLIYKGEDILVPGYYQGKGKKRDRMWGYIDCYREYGVNKGLIKFNPQEFLPLNYTFVNYYPDDEQNGGHITYNGVYHNGNKVSLQSLLGLHYIPTVYIEMFGDWHNSPVFRKVDFEVRELNKDSLIYRITHSINPAARENIQFNDTLTDSLSQGEYAIFGELYTNNNQIVNSNINYFSVIGNEVALLMHSDTNDVPAGWVFHPNIKVINPLPAGQENLHLIVSSNDSLYIDTIFDIDSCSTDSFPISVSPNVPTVLNGELILSSGDTLRKDVLLNVLAGNVAIDVVTPEYVNFEPFEVKNIISNNSGISQEVIIKRRINTDSLIDTVLIDPNDKDMSYDTLSTINSDTLYVTVSGDFGEIEKKLPIRLGINCNLAFDTLYNVSPDSVEMSAVVRNEGVYPVDIKALFCLVDSVQMLKRGVKQIFNTARDVGRDFTFGKFVEDIVRANIDTSLSYFTLNAGSEDTIPIMFDTHNPGNYVLQGFLYTDSSSIFLDSSQSNVNIVENSLISIDSIIVSAYCDSSGNVPVSVIVTNGSYNSFAGDMILSSPVCYMDTVVDIPSQKTDTIIFSLQHIIDEGRYPFTAQVRDGGVSIAEKITDLQFSPIYTFNSIPDDYCLPLGDSGIVSLSIGNIGNAKGNRTISANWADVINLNTSMEIDPLSADSASQVFYIPNDMPGGEYICNVSILNGYYPETDTFFKLRIEGVNITASDSLDKPVYYSGDTARLSILIDNHNMWSGILDAAIQYGNYSKDTSFILGGMEKSISDNTSSRDTLYFDTSAIYMLEPMNTEGNDSISFNWNVSNDSLKLSFRTDSVIGKGNWTDADTGVNYPISDWTQIKVENKLTSNQWMNSFSYILNAIDTTVFDTFPSQRENIEFTLPVSDSVRKAAWGIYYPSGRSVVLDERYIYTMNDSLTVVTDKGRYGLLDTVNATVYKSFPGTNYNFRYHVYFSPTNIVEDSFSLSGDSAKFSFVVPDWTRSGSYSIDYQLSNNSKSHYGYKLHHNAEYMEETSFNKVINDRQLISHKNFVNNQKKIAKEWMEGKRIIERSDSAISEGSHPFDVTGITVYFNKVITDTSTYHIEDTAKLWINIYSDVDMNCSLILSSTGSEVDTFDLSLSKETPNNFELRYPIIGFKRGMNEMYLNLIKDSVSIAGMIQYFDVEIPDTTAPEITIISEPENTYSSIPYEVNVQISNPDSSGTMYDTLYYRTSSIGSYWHAVTSSKTGDNTYRYIIPAQSRGTLIEYYIAARDSFGNCTQYPGEGLKSFWVLTPMKPLWSEPTYNTDTVVVLSWSPPSEMITYHCGIKSDTVNVKDTIVAVKFVPQYLPARLNKIGVSFADIDSTKSGTMFNIKSRALDNARDIDTVIVYVYQVCDSLPGAQIDSFIFERSVNGYEEFDLPDIQVNENGIFIGLKCSSDKGIIFDGYGTGSHSAIYSDNKWSDLTPGEAHISGFMSYIPDTGKRQSSILSFNVLRYSYNDTIWSEIGSGIKDTVFVDSSANENIRYSYKVEAKFDNPNNSFFSSPWDVFIDLTPPSLDTVLITSSIGGIVQINAILRDTSGIRWDSFGYKCNDSIFVIPPDSSTGSNYYYSMPFREDTLNYFIVAYDSSLICNNARYPDTGYYRWINSNFGILGKRLVDSTYVAKLPQNPVRNGTILKYALSGETNVKIALYNIMGRKLKTLDSGLKKQGYYSVSIGNDVMQSQGVYFIKVELGDYEKTIKLVKLK